MSLAAGDGWEGVQAGEGGVVDDQGISETCGVKSLGTKEDVFTLLILSI